jgi:tetratricopeptide (TPR) repeat protein
MIFRNDYFYPMSSIRLLQIREMLLSEPLDEFLNYALAIELEQEGQLTEAIRVIREILERNENYGGGYYKLGELLAKEGQKAEAIAIYHKGIAIAQKQRNAKATRELRAALENLEDE